MDKPAALPRPGFFQKAGAYLQLVRFPNTFTAMADAAAGVLIVAGSRAEFREMFCAAAASFAFYGGGCALNDFFDRELDARERPFRPIPSGNVSAAEALALACFLFAAGLACAWAAGAVRAAVVLCFLIVSYDAFTRRFDFIGPLNMGACRAANLLLGMSAASGAARDYLIFPVITLIYVFSLTTVSRFEVRGDLRRGGRAAKIGLAAISLVFISLVLSGRMLPGSIFFIGFLAMTAGPAIASAFTRSTPRSVGRAVKWMVLGIVMLDAAYVAGTQGIAPAIPVVAFLAPALFFARRFRVA